MIDDLVETVMHDYLADKGRRDAASDWRYRNSEKHVAKPWTARFRRHTSTPGFERAPVDEKHAYLDAYGAEWGRLRALETA